MKSFDVPTASFMLTLRINNLFWYNCIVRMAKHNAKLVRKALQECAMSLPELGLKPEGVNAFQVCTAVNQGRLSEDAFNEHYYQSVEAYQKEFKQELTDLLNGNK